MIMSSLARVSIISPNKSKRKAKIDTITIHCMACNATVVALGNHFAKKSAQASSNYGIGSDGLIACYVPEEYRSWCSSSAANDQRAITIEVANDGGAPDWHVSKAALSALVDLLVDICKRNGIPELRWKADKSLIGQVDKQNMTVHRWFAKKSCPGDYLFNLHSSIAAEVNARLNGAQPKPEKIEVAKYTVKKGDSGENVKLLQKDLNQFGCGLKEDGKFGPASVAALKAWQTKYKLTADGSYGPKSYKKMCELLL